MKITLTKSIVFVRCKNSVEVVRGKRFCDLDLCTRDLESVFSSWADCKTDGRSNRMQPLAAWPGAADNNKIILHNSEKMGLSEKLFRLFLLEWQRQVP